MGLLFYLSDYNENISGLLIERVANPVVGAVAVLSCY